MAIRTARAHLMARAIPTAPAHLMDRVTPTAPAPRKVLAPRLAPVIPRSEQAPPAYRLWYSS